MPARNGINGKNPEQNVTAPAFSATSTNFSMADAGLSIHLQYSLVEALLELFSLGR